ncbi:hypothetical protein DXC24_15010 [Clostridium sp. OM08-29]|nr:hypothetical protein DXC24_15010 [Clostridium sp. OM08-29]
MNANELEELERKLRLLNRPIIETDSCITYKKIQDYDKDEQYMLYEGLHCGNKKIEELCIEVILNGAFERRITPNGLCLKMALYLNFEQITLINHMRYGSGGSDKKNANNDDLNNALSERIIKSIKNWNPDLKQSLSSYIVTNLLPSQITETRAEITGTKPSISRNKNLIEKAKKFAAENGLYECSDLDIQFIDAILHNYNRAEKKMPLGTSFNNKSINAGTPLSIDDDNFQNHEPTNTIDEFNVANRIQAVLSDRGIYQLEDPEEYRALFEKIREYGNYDEIDKKIINSWYYARLLQYDEYQAFMDRLYEKNRNRKTETLKSVEIPSKYKNEPTPEACFKAFVKLYPEYEEHVKKTVYLSQYHRVVMMDFIVKLHDLISGTKRKKQSRIRYTANFKEDKILNQSLDEAFENGYFDDL